MKPRSKEITEGLEAMPMRSLLKADDLNDEDLEKPLVAIANSWNQVVPGHLHLKKLGEKTAEGVREAGVLPFSFRLSECATVLEWALTE